MSSSVENKAIPSLRFKDFKTPWKLLKIKDFVINQKGSMKIGPFGSQLKRSTFVKDGFKVFGQENIFLNDFNFGDRFITENHFKNLKSNEILKGDFVISTMGTIGKCAVVPTLNQRGIMDSHMIRLRLSENIHPDFLSQSFVIFKTRKQIKRLSVGGIMDGLSMGIINELKFSLPLLPEQNKIASFLTSVDDKISLLKKKKELLEQYKKGVMQKIFSQEIRFKDDNGNDFPDWKLSRLDRVVELKHGYQFMRGDFTKDGLPIIKINNVVGSELNLNDLTYISSDRYNEFKKFEIKNGDILMSLTGNIGRVIEVQNLKQKVIQNYRVGNFIPVNNYLIKPFLKYLLSSRMVLGRFEQLSNQSAQANFGKQDMNKISVNIPVLDEQKKIAEFLLNLDKKIVLVSSQIDKTKEFKKGLLQQMFV